MKVKIEKLEWTNKCCSCFEKIAPNDTTVILILKETSSYHMCKECAMKLTHDIDFGLLSED